MDELSKYDKIELEKGKMGDLCNKLDELNEEKEILARKIKNMMKEDDLRVSDHAIVAYFKRVLGYDIKEIKEKILTDDIVLKYNTFGYGTYYNKECGVVVRNNTAITVLPKDSEKK